MKPRSNAMSWPPEIPRSRTYWLRNASCPSAVVAQPPSAEREHDGILHLDLLIEHGCIAALAPAGTATEGIDLAGSQVWPCFVDAHTHLDKGHIWTRSPNRDGSFGGAVAATAADRAAYWSADDMAARADFALRCAYAHGTVAVRTHLDTYLPHAETSWAMFRQLRRDWEGRVDLQAVSITQLENFDGEDGDKIADLVSGSRGVLGAVTRLGGEAGAALPSRFSERLRRIFDSATQRELDLDFHVDESGEAGATALREVAITMMRSNFRGRVQCGHCCSLSMQSEKEAMETIRLCAEAGLAVVVLPMCNMFLQDRALGRTPRWRGVTLVQEMVAAGVRVSFASDNARDPFYGYGDLDMLEVFRESVRILHLDMPVSPWPAAVTATPAHVLRLDGHGVLRLGASADLVIFRGRSWSELLSRPQTDRVVVRHGASLDAAVPDYRELDWMVNPAA